MLFVRQSTAATITVGPAVDKTDGVTPETGLGSGTVDEIGVYKHDATSLTDISGTTTLTHRAGGMYTATLSTSDTGTVGRLIFYMRDDDVCLPVWHEFTVLPANAYDSLVAGTDTLQSDLTQYRGTACPAADTAGYPKVTVKDGTGTGEIDLSSGTVTVGTNNDKTGYGLADGAITAAKIGTDAITADKIADAAIGADQIATDAIDADAIATDAFGALELAAGAATEIADAVWNSLTSEMTASGSIGEKLADWTLGTDDKVLISADQDVYSIVGEVRMDEDAEYDRYVVRWCKNGVPITSGITVPKLTVYDRTDASALISNEDMSDVGSGQLLYATTSDRATKGKPYEMYCTATIDGSSRTAATIVGRDI